MRTSTTLAAFILSVAAILGCGESSNTRAATLAAHYAEIRGGMSRHEVQALLGPGRKLTKSDPLDLQIQHCSPDNSLVWQDGQTSITVAFDREIVVAKLRAVAPAKRN